MAYKAAENTAKELGCVGVWCGQESGLSPYVAGEKAQEVAQDVAEKSGMSSAEAP